MRAATGILRAALLVGALVGGTGCQVARVAGPAEVESVGTFAGRLPDGRALELELAWAPAGLLGAARVDGGGAAFVQRGGQRVAGEVRMATGEVLPVYVELAGGGRVSLVTEAGGVSLEPIVRDASWAAWPGDAPGGGLSGTYVAADLEAGLDSITLHVRDGAAWGQARVLGRDALVAAWVQADGGLRGDLVFADSSTVQFTARAPEGGGLEVSAGGAPATLRRVEP